MAMQHEIYVMLFIYKTNSNTVKRLLLNKTFYFYRFLAESARYSPENAKSALECFRMLRFLECLICFRVLRIFRMLTMLQNA